MKIRKHYKIDIRNRIELLEKYPRLHMWLIFGKESYIAARNMKKFSGGQFDTREAKKDKKTLEAQQ